MSSVESLINSITIYAGLPILICGVSGSLLNIRLLWKTRRDSCAFIFLASSLINCFVLLYGLLTRILSVGFHLDWSSTNRIWCKTRVTFSQASFLISLTCLCLASIDRFLVSCRQEKYRKLSRLSFAIWAVIATIVFWLIYFIPNLIYTDLSENPSTGVVSCLFAGNNAFIKYEIYFSFPVFYGLLPTVILTTTGIMTYRNTTKLQIGRQRQLVQRQLTSMMLIQVPVILISTVSYVIFTEYTILTTSMAKTSNQRTIEQVLINIFSTTCYIPFACPFFVFLASSKTFREEAKMLILCRKTNQIQPYSTTTMRNTGSQSVKNNRNNYVNTKANNVARPSP